MALKKLLFLSAFGLLCGTLQAQQDTIALKEVIIADTQLRDFSQTQSVITLSDSVIGRAEHSLTSVLLYNTNIYFKENGPGMVSSPSFRGTTAQQTAVVWNGININSQLNGQTDFNTINARDFGEISVRAGGGSVAYGSSAIGGSIHLDDKLVFNKHFTNTIRADYGSYDTYRANYKLALGDKKYSVNLSAGYNESANRYRFAGYNVYNDNGQFYNSSVNAAIGYKLNEKNILRLYSYYFDGERHFSRTLAAPSRSMYNDLNTRNLLEWTGLYGRFTSRLKAAYLDEQYRYYENHQTGNYTTGRVRSYIARYDATYDFTQNLKLNTILDFTQNHGTGSDLGDNTRNTGSVAVLLHHQLTGKLGYEAGLRKEQGSAYNSPLLFSAGAKFRANDFYTLKVNASRNFRAPTFNDLYWSGTGNPNLDPESSYQAEVGNDFTYGDFKLTLTGYYIRLKDMLRWIPGTDGIWRPENVDKAKTYGGEAVLNWDKQTAIGTFSLTGTYAYTISQRDGSSSQLIYVPKNKATATLGYNLKKFSAYYRTLITGQVFTTSDNSAALDAYDVAGFGAQYTFNIAKGMAVGAQVNNLYYEMYQNVAVRPMPGRNYNVYVNLKI